MSTLAVLIVAVTAFLCVVTWCSTWRAIRFKQADDFLTAQREGYAAQRNTARDLAKQAGSMYGLIQHDDEGDK